MLETRFAAISRTLATASGRRAVLPLDTIFIAAVGCVEPAPRNATFFDQAVQVCALDGRRLLTSAELLALMGNQEIDTFQAEWPGADTAGDRASFVARDSYTTKVIAECVAGDQRNTTFDRCNRADPGV